MDQGLPPMDHLSGDPSGPELLASAQGLKLQGLYDAIDTLWLLVACFFVFSMQIGFAFLEAGGVRAVNVITITFKNLGDCSIGAFLWFLIGSKIASPPQPGQSLYGFSGVPSLSEPDATASALLMFMYLATATTIVSGAVAERIAIGAYYTLTVAISAFHYPMVVHWVWADDGKGHTGWLRELGTVDFAGSLVVHMNSGIIAFIAAWVLGPRKLPGGVSPFSKEGKNIVTPHNKFLQAAGVMFLWVGWIGFNAGSVPSFTAHVDLAERAAISTVIAGSTGAICGMIGTYITHRHMDLGQVSNSLLGALVCVTASCAFISPFTAMGFGALGSLTYFASNKFYTWMELDDVVEASAVHASCGLVGTLLVPLGDERLLGRVLGRENFTLNRWDQLGKQVVGVLAVAAWSAFWGLLICLTLKKLGWLRVREELELEGCDGEFFQCYGYDYIGDMMREAELKRAHRKYATNDDGDDEGENIQLLGVEMRGQCDSSGSKFKFLQLDTILSQLSDKGPVRKLRERKIRNTGYEPVSDGGGSLNGSGPPAAPRTGSRNSSAPQSHADCPFIPEGTGDAHPLERPNSRGGSPCEPPLPPSRQPGGPYHSAESSAATQDRGSQQGGGGGASGPHRLSSCTGESLNSVHNSSASAGRGGSAGAGGSGGSQRKMSAGRVVRAWADDASDTTATTLNQKSPSNRFAPSETRSAAGDAPVGVIGPPDECETFSELAVPVPEVAHGDAASLAHRFSVGSLASGPVRFDDVVSLSQEPIVSIPAPGEYSEKDISEVLERVVHSACGFDDSSATFKPDPAIRPASADVRYDVDANTDTRDSIYSAPAVCAVDAYIPGGDVRVPPMRARGSFMPPSTSSRPSSARSTTLGGAGLECQQTCPMPPDAGGVYRAPQSPVGAAGREVSVPGVGGGGGGGSGGVLPPPPPHVVQQQVVQRQAQQLRQQEAPSSYEASGEGASSAGHGVPDALCQHCRHNHWAIHRTRKRTNNTKSHTLECLHCTQRTSCSVLNACPQFRSGNCTDDNCPMLHMARRNDP